MTSKEYKVIEILSNDKILINYGNSDGAKKGRNIRIILKGEDVLDYDTQRKLGTLDIIKEELEITTVYPNFSICEKIIIEEFNPFIPALNRTKKTIKSSKLKVNNEQISNRKFINNPPPIEIGDIVQII